MKICSVSECMTNVVAKGVCDKHYRRLKNHGSTDGSMFTRESVEARLWRRVNKAGQIVPHIGSQCWEWVGNTIKDGYGLIRDRKKMVLTHRLSWTMAYGAIPDGMLVLHHCDNPPCVNPSHLFIGTDADNASDRDSKGRRKPLIGEMNGRAKLRELDVRSIRNDVRSTKEIAASYNISIPLVQKIRHGDIWKHVV